MKNLRLNVREIVLMGMLVAVTIVLDMVFKVYQQANGGSINLAMVGLVLISLSFSWWKTWFATAIVFGLLSSILDGYVAYYLFDYAFALSGFFLISIFRLNILQKKNLKGLLILLGTFTLAFSWRLVMHILSGVLYFEVDWLGSSIYNIGYLFPSFLLSTFAVIVLYYSNLLTIIRNLTTQKMI